MGEYETGSEWEDPPPEKPGRFTREEKKKIAEEAAEKDQTPQELLRDWIREAIEDTKEE